MVHGLQGQPKKTFYHPTFSDTFTNSLKSLSLRIFIAAPWGIRPSAFLRSEFFWWPASLFIS